MGVCEPGLMKSNCMNTNFMGTHAAQVQSELLQKTKQKSLSMEWNKAKVRKMNPESSLTSFVHAFGNQRPKKQNIVHAAQSQESIWNHEMEPPLTSQMLLTSPARISTCPNVLHGIDAWHFERRRPSVAPRPSALRISTQLQTPFLGTSTAGAKLAFALARACARSKGAPYSAIEVLLIALRTMSQEPAEKNNPLMVGDVQRPGGVRAPNHQIERRCRNVSKCLLSGRPHAPCPNKVLLQRMCIHWTAIGLHSSHRTVPANPDASPGST